MRVLVTGASGYLGAAVVRALLAGGHEPIALAHVTPPPSEIERRDADLRDPASLAAAITGVDAVCHLAGLTRARESWERPVDYFEVNTSGTIALLHGMRDAGVRRLVFASTGSVYGSPERQPMDESLPDAPSHPYAASKAAAEAAITWSARGHDLGAAVLRVFNAAGGNDPDPTRLMPRILTALRADTPLSVNGDGSVVRDYLHVDDVAAAFVAAVEFPLPPGKARRFNVASGRGSSITDVIDAAERVTGRRVQRASCPTADEPAALVGDPARIITELGWRPRRSDLDSIVRDAWRQRG